MKKNTPIVSFSLESLLCETITISYSLNSTAEGSGVEVLAT